MRTLHAVLAAAMILAGTAAHALDPGDRPSTARDPSTNFNRLGVGALKTDSLTIQGQGIACAPGTTCDASPLRVAPGPAPTRRSLQDLLGAVADARDYNAACTGSGNDAGALTAMASATGRVTVGPCVLRVAADTTLTVPVVVQTGGRLLVDGVTLTLTQPISGPAAKQIFQIVNGGKVVLPSTQTEAFPEWWYDGSGDWRPALQAAVGSGAKKISLACRDYPISNTWRIGADVSDAAALARSSFLTIAGCGGYGYNPGTSTRILIGSATADGIQIGPDAPSSDPSMSGPTYYPRYLDVHNIQVERTAAPRAASVGSEFASPAGFRLQYLQTSRLHELTSIESSIGFAYTGLVHVKVDNAFAFRSISGSNVANDFAVGHYLNGLADIGLAGGNASLYLGRINSTIPNAGVGCTGIGCIGLYAQGAFVDTFIRDLETTYGQTALYLNGVAGTCNTISVSCIGKNIDFIVDHLVADQCSGQCIKINGVNQFGALSIINSYVGMASTSASPVGIRITDSSGQILLHNNQIIGGGNLLAGGNGYGIWATNSSKIKSTSNQLSLVRQPTVLENVSFSEFSDQINNPAGAYTQGAGIFIGGTSKNNVVRPQITGGAGMMAQCILMPTSAVTAFNHFDVNAVDFGVCANGVVLGYDGRSITAPGVFGSNDVVGLTGAWATYVPTIAPQNAGSVLPTFSNVAATYNQIGRRVEVHLTATVTDPGTGNGGGLLVSLPIAAKNPQPGALISGREDGVTGAGITGRVVNSSQILVNLATGAYPASSAGQQINVGVSYEPQ